jgi:hypothetical protein
VGERVRSGRELREEALRDGEMEPAIFGVERDDLGAARSGTRDFTQSEFNRVQTGYIGNGQTGDMGNTSCPCLGPRPTP